MQTIRHPVTLGSRVPLWPVFSTRSIRLSHATTSCEEGLDGLSRLITPDLPVNHGQLNTSGDHRERQLYVGCDVAFEGTTAGRNGGEMAGANEKLVIIFEEERPF
jgi:hypothetical protein